MASNIVELFGYSPTDPTPLAVNARSQKWCPFIGSTCLKTLSDGSESGACTLKPMTSGPVICCPYRLYANEYQILKDVAKLAFGPNCKLFPGKQAKNMSVSPDEHRIAVFGKHWGKELRLPNRGKSGGYFVDWILARLDGQGQLAEFVAAEVQSIDTTGNYQAERRAHLDGVPFIGSSTAGFNWENVNKRILPQLIYKGHVLRRERLCHKGLYFICPKPVHDKIRERLGGHLMEYRPQPGALSLLWYDIATEQAEHGLIRNLYQVGAFTTTVDQVALAFTSPSNLPDSNVYEAAIQAVLS
jgi:hypothetical protein